MDKAILTHQDYMSLALQLAERGRCTVSPNPMVGCMIAKDGHIFGQGFHQQAGQAHAEIIALQAAGAAAHGAIMYLTLEPCCHYGRTPPCTLALIRAGIKKVYVACLDPNPVVAGKGVEELRSAGIEVEIGLCATAAKKLNEIFFHYITTKRPFIIAKWAMSLDGKTITHPADSRQISCDDSYQHTQRLRQQVDAILIGAKAAMNDNPLLTVRLSSQQPIRIILSSQGQLPLDLAVFSTTIPGKTIIATTAAADKQWCNELTKKHIEVLILPKNKHAQVDLYALLAVLAEKEITSVLVEGGMTVHQSFFAEKLVDKIHVYLSPTIIGSLEKKQALDLNFLPLGRDVCLTAYHLTGDTSNV